MIFEGVKWHGGVGGGGKGGWGGGIKQQRRREILHYTYMYVCIWASRLTDFPQTHFNYLHLALSRLKIYPTLQIERKKEDMYNDNNNNNINALILSSPWIYIDIDVSVCNKPRAFARALAYMCILQVSRDFRKIDDGSVFCHRCAFVSQHPMRYYYTYILYIYA